MCMSSLSLSPLLRNEWEGMTNDERRKHLLQLCSVADTKRVYHLVVNAVQVVVCHAFWTDVFQVANEFVSRACRCK